MPDRRVGSVNQQKGHQGSGAKEASQKGAATYRNKSGKQDGARGLRKGRATVVGRCSAREDRGQKRALRGKSRRSGTKYRWNQ
jgi:hypothetical protein